MYVTGALVYSGSVILDFEPELRRLRPQVLVVNAGGAFPEKRRLCAEQGGVSGLARSHYEGAYWPTCIDHVVDAPALSFVQQALYLKPLGPRP